MQPHHLFAVVLALSALSGLLSPYLLLVLAYAPVWVPNWSTGSAGTVFYLASLITATTVLLVSGVPAALAERAFPALGGTLVPLWIWVAGAGILSLPALLRFISLAG